MRDTKGRFKKGNHPKTEFKKGHKINLGKHKSNETKEKISNSKKGKRIDSIYTIERNRKVSLAKLGDKNSSKRPEVREKQRIIRQEQILRNGGGPNIGKNECQILDELKVSNNIKIIRQYPIQGYFIDGYCKELNIAFEVDEEHHKKKKQKDKGRQKYIQNKLNCKFVRIKDGLKLIK